MENSEGLSRIQSPSVRPVGCVGTSSIKTSLVCSYKSLPIHESGTRTRCADHMPSHEGRSTPYKKTTSFSVPLHYRLLFRPIPNLTPHTAFLLNKGERIRRSFTPSSISPPRVMHHTLVPTRLLRHLFLPPPILMPLHIPSAPALPIPTIPPPCRIAMILARLPRAT